ncbi:acetolactate synthase small subunit [Oceanobacillus indicireducens]|uniref:Acetolactate synthase small subunit n=1 Tax=Oceanobacillus indicireducens TaxID=1004261 RepID=A0A917XTX2_9BACI|nr:acetolactate synthase small subunit [Oceanobacillus indicireducens]GGN51494.1 acetolactate synthase small subunit [Oceanobacillus indicireducens]
MKRIISCTVQNRGGVLNRITGMFSKRHFNIESITVGESETEGMAKMTFVVNVEDEHKLEQLTKQLHKQIDVIKVSDITEKSVVARELALVKVTANSQLRAEIQGLIDPFRGTVVDISKETMTIQVTGKTDKIDAFILLLKPFGIKEIARTGVTALLRGQQAKPYVAEVNSLTI